MSARDDLFWGSLSACVAAGCACLRVEAHTAAFLVLVGGGAAVFGPAALALSPRVPWRVAWLLTALGLAAPILAPLARVLKATTHHRPLGAVTFAFAAAGVIAVLAVASTRVFALARQSSGPAWSWMKNGLVAVACLGPVVLLARTLAHPALRMAVFDIGVGLGSSAVLRLIPWPAIVTRAATVAGLPVWLAAVGVGLAAARVTGIGAAELASPVLSAPLAWIS